MNAFEVKIGMLYQFSFFIEPTLLLLHIFQTAQFSTFCQDLGCTKAVKTRRRGTNVFLGWSRATRGRNEGRILRKVSVNARLNWDRGMVC